MIAKIRLTMRTAQNSSRNTMLTTPRPAAASTTLRMFRMIATAVTLMVQLRASVDSTAVFGPRVRKTTQISSAGTIRMMLPKCANDAHWRSSASDNGAAAAGGVGAAGSVMEVPFGGNTEGAECVTPGALIRSGCYLISRIETG